MRQFLERKTAISFLFLASIFNCLRTAPAAVAVLDPDGEPMWGHVYISGGVVSYEFFRAKFGGKYDCNLEGSHVVDLGLGCDLLEDIQDVQGKIAIVNRGNCSFNDKAIVAQKAGK